MLISCTSHSYEDFDVVIVKIHGVGCLTMLNKLLMDS